MVSRALLFTDVVDSTRLAERLGDVASARLWTEHDRRARDLLERHRGREIGRADGLFMVFDDAADAARCALAYHAALSDLPMRARAGLHVGPVSLRPNAPADIARGAVPTEIEGLATPITARIMALAGAGQTLISRAARDAVVAALPAGSALECHGHYRLKGIEDPVELYELGETARAAFAPPRDVEKAYRVVRVGEMWMPARETRHSLPAERDGFVGRVAELRALATSLDNGARLVTVLGPGGSGKTRLVRRYGWAWLGDWPGGVYFADLSEARSADGIHFAVATALGVELGREDPVVQLGNVIAGRGRCLVVLDNVEQVVELAAGTVGRWLNVAGNASFLATSRERLHLAGEQVMPLEPLPLDHDAIELFALRARAQRPEFAVEPDNRDAVVEICRLLDGLPLAIELAAARIRIFSPAQLVERLRDRFAVLAGAKGANARQATLRRAIDWSWDLLTPWEQSAFAQCSVFAGGFTLHAAEAVLDISAWPRAGPVMDVIQALSDKSLLRTWIPSDERRHDIDEPYFGMYLSIREYAAEKLATVGPTQVRASETRHGSYFAGFGTDEAIGQLSGTGGVKQGRALALEIENLVVACRRAVQRGDTGPAVAACRAAWHVLALQGPAALGIALGGEVLAMPALEASQRAVALLVRGEALRRAGRVDDAKADFERAIAISRESGNRLRLLRALDDLGNLGREQGRMDEARTLMEEALELARRAGDRHQEGIILGNLGLVHGEQSEVEESRNHFEQALAIHRELGDLRLEAICINNLGVVCNVQRRLDEAAALFEHARDLDREVGNRRDEAIATCQLGQVRDGQGRHDEARALYEAALVLARDVGERRLEGYVLQVLGDMLRKQEQLDAARDHLERALSIHRALGSRRLAGATLGSLGELHAHRQRFAEAREAFDAGEALLRQVRDRLQLVILLCDRGLAEHAAGDAAAARTALAGAEAEAVNVPPGSEFELGLQRLRRVLGR